MNSPVYAEIIHGVETELVIKGVNMLYKGFREEGDIVSWFDKNDVDGLLLFGVHDKHHYKISRLLSNIPIVGVLGDRHSYDFDHIFYDIDMVSDLAVGYFKEENIEEVLCVCPTMHRQRFAYLAEANSISTKIIKENDKVFVTNESVNAPNHNELNKLITDYLRDNPLPKGIFIPCDSYAVPLYSILMQKGYVPGDDFKVVSVNNEASLLSGLMPKPATVDIRSFELGRAAVQRLIWRRENLSEPTSVLTLPPLLVRS
jgi:DNA-binding LacI/PurR family transcriptional regulator